MPSQTLPASSYIAWLSERSLAGAPARIGARSGSRVQRGSHLRLRHPTNARLPLTVPDHDELKTGLLRALIRDAGMSVEEFVEALRR
jgi:HicA-like toxin of HicAB toxin-antitoxin system